MSTRRLAAIMFTDVVGYTAMMEKDEEHAMRTLSAHKKDVEELSKKYNSDVIEYFGDGSLTLFNSVHDAVECGRELQKRLSTDGMVPLRIGIHIGEVLQQDGKIFGDGVNVASRVESVGYAGTVLVSQPAYDKVRNQTAFQFKDLGEFSFKNVEKPMRVYGLVDDQLPPLDTSKLDYGKATRLSRTRTWFYAGMILLAIALVAGGIAIWIQSGTSSAAGDSPSEGLVKLAVFPFDIKGSTDIEYLREGLVDVVSTKIDGIAGFTAIDPNMTIGYFRENEGRFSSPSGFAKAAEDLGAREYILGNVIKLGEDIRLKISQYRIDGTLLTTEEVVISDMDGLLSGVDDLIRQTVADKYYSSGQTTTAAQAMYSSDMEALRLFLEGEEKRRLGYYEEASRLYLNALERDSTMPLAWLSLWQVCSWSFQCDLAETEILANARKYSDRLPMKLQDYIRVSADWRMFGKEDYEKQIRELIDRYGESTELLTQLGEVVFHSHIRNERPATEALPYFWKAFEYDPGNVEVLNHVIQLLSYMQDEERLKEIADRIPRGSVNWSVAQVAYLCSRDEEWTEPEVEDILADPGFAIDPIFLRARSENNLDKFGELFAELEKLNGSEFEESEAPIHTLRLYWYGKHNEAMSRASDTRFDQMIKYSMNISYLGISLPGLDSMKMEPRALLKTGYAGGPFPDDFILALIAAVDSDSEAFRKHYGKLQELSGDDGTYSKSSLIAEGYWYHTQGDYVLSNELLDSAMTSFGRPVNAVMNAFLTGAITLLQAENYIALGDKRRALLHYTILMDVLDAGDDPKIAFSWLRRAEILSELDKNEEALNFLNMFLKMYADCDPVFKPWVARATELREEVFSRIN